MGRRGKGRTLGRRLSRLNPATVIATIALFAALGGGYATAFSGSGTVQKGARVGVPLFNQVVVRSLTGIGAIEADCAGLPGEEDARVFFTNSSGETLNVEVMGLVGGGDWGPIVSGGIVQIGGDDTMFVHLSPVDGTKTPQADVQVTAVGTDYCPTSRISVLATNTQE